jgi:hypothetical protein
LGEVDCRGGLEDSGGAGQEIVGTVDPLQQNIRDGEERHKGRREEKRRKEGKTSSVLAHVTRKLWEGVWK